MQQFSECQPIVLGYIEHDDEVLLTRRPVGVHQAGCWEFPGGKVEVGENFIDALRRELREEIGVQVLVGDEIAVTRYAYPDICVELHLYHCVLQYGVPRPVQVAEVRWVAADALGEYEFPPANVALLVALSQYKAKAAERT